MAPGENDDVEPQSRSVQGEIMKEKEGQKSFWSNLWIYLSGLMAVIICSLIYAQFCKSHSNINYNCDQKAWYFSQSSFDGFDYGLISGLIFFSILIMPFCQAYIDKRKFGGKFDILNPWLIFSIPSTAINLILSMYWVTSVTMTCSTGAESSYFIAETFLNSYFVYFVFGGEVYAVLIWKFYIPRYWMPGRIEILFNDKWNDKKKIKVQELVTFFKRNQKDVELALSVLFTKRGYPGNFDKSKGIVSLKGRDSEGPAGSRGISSVAEVTKGKGGVGTEPGGPGGAPHPDRRIFLSYSSEEKGIAETICASLEDAVIRCWMAPRDVPPGMKYAEAIVRAIKSCSVFIFIFSANSNESDQVLREIEIAASKKIPIIPYKIEDVPYSEALEYYIQNLHWIDALEPTSSENMEKLAVAVRELLRKVDNSN